MPKNWKTYKLNEVAKVIDSLHKTPKYADYGFPMVRAQEITGGVLDISSTASVSKEVYEDFSKNHKSTIGDLVFSRVGAHCGKISYVATNIPFCLGQNTAFILPQKIDNRFLYYLLSSSLVQEQLTQNAVVSSYKTISLKTVRELDITVPPNPEQTQIANILSAIDDKIENNLATNKTIEDMAMALYKHWFVDFGPFQDGEFVDTELGLIPKGWEVKRLDELANFKNGKGIKRSDRTEDGLYKIFGSNGFIGRTNKIMFKDYVIAIGRVGANYGEIHYSTEPCWISDNAITVQPKVKECFWWLLQTLRLIDYSNFAGGSAQPLITQGAVKEFIVSVPREKELLDFSLKLKQLFDNLNSNLKENQSLTKLRDTLLPKLISGEVRLKEFRAQLENLV